MLCCENFNRLLFVDWGVTLKTGNGVPAERETVQYQVNHFLPENRDFSPSELYQTTLIHTVSHFQSQNLEELKKLKDVVDSIDVDKQENVGNVVDFVAGIRGIV